MCANTEANSIATTKSRDARRRYTTTEKLWFLNATKEAGEPLSSIGRRFGISASLLFRWKRELLPANDSKMANSVLGRLRERLANLQAELEAANAENIVLRVAIDQLDASVEQQKPSFIDTAFTGERTGPFTTPDHR
jgi:transposase